MAANPKKGRYGHLKAPKERAVQLRELAHLTLAEAGRRMGVGEERARQLYRVYGIPRTKHRRTALSGMTLADLRWERDNAHRCGDLKLAVKYAIAIDHKRGLY